MERERESTLNTLRAMVTEMSDYELKAALLMVLNGADPVYAIDHSFNPKRRPHPRNNSK